MGGVRALICGTVCLLAAACGGSKTVSHPVPSRSAFSSVGSAQSGLQAPGAAPAPACAEATDGNAGAGGATTGADSNELSWADGDPGNVVVDALNVYWAQGAYQIWGMPLAGGSAVLLADQQSLPHGLAVDGTYIYWLNTDGSVMKAPIAGGAWTELATGPVAELSDPGQRGLALDADSVYWINSATGQSDGQVLKVSKNGGKVTVLADGEFHPVAIAVDSVNVYYTTFGWGFQDNPVATGRVLKVPALGGTPTVIASGQSSPNALVVDSTNVYWSNLFGNNIMKAALNDGAPVMLATVQGTPQDLAVDSEHVYWLQGFANDDAVMSAPLAGGDATVLDSSAPGNLTPFSIALDCHHVYWTGATLGVVDPGNTANDVDPDGGVLVVAK